MGLVVTLGDDVTETVQSLVNGGATNLLVAQVAAAQAAMLLDLSTDEVSATCTNDGETYTIVLTYLVPYSDIVQTLTIPVTRS